jgi:hypothetical protein
MTTNLKDVISGSFTPHVAAHGGLCSTMSRSACTVALLNERNLADVTLLP